MANLFSGFLDNLGKGLTNPKGNLGDFAHAARLYNDSAFRLAPKTKFLYHVVFNLSQDAIGQTSFKAQHQTTIGLLVKEIELPKFKMAVDVVQQYNRKRAVQTKIEYDPINITFHDDNLGVTTALWSLYYGYYFADSHHGGSAGAMPNMGGGPFSLSGFLNSAVPGITNLFGSKTGGVNGSSASGVPAGYQRQTLYDKTNTFKYGLDNDSSKPFFTSIQIFQLSKQKYQCFTLVNPIITSWQHDTLDNSDSSPVSNKMQVQYETVIYGTGAISTGNPTGFATDFYDNMPSPLSILGGGKVGLFGQGGVLGGAADIVGGIASGSAFSSIGAFAGTLIKGANVINNAKKLTSNGLRQEGFGLLTGAITAATGVNVSGVANVLFPKNSGNGQGQTTAAQLTQYTQGTGPLVRDNVTAFFAARPGALTSLARTTVFSKDVNGGSLNDINTKWNNLSSAARASYEATTLDKVISGDPAVQYQYQLIKRQG